MYPLIALPPVAGTDHTTRSRFADGDVADVIDGACGTVVAVTEAVAAEARDVPAAFVAVTVNV